MNFNFVEQKKENYDTSKIIEREIPGMNTYKIAEKFAIMLNESEEIKLVCVVESWKLYPKENEKTEKKDKISSNE